MAFLNGLHSLGWFDFNPTNSTGWTHESVASKMLLFISIETIFLVMISFIDGLSSFKKNPPEKAF
jgi:hypothetical protein